MNLARFHGVFAPNSKHRAAMTWAQRLKRVFRIDIETCEKCQGPVRIIACIEEPALIRQILELLRKKESEDSQTQLPPERAPPQMGLFDQT
ncbi:MAG: hypothetical protein H7A04_15890 [Pseudomonadales bacterium]|nr:hypothetical protein [Pseudomonadales bacterium]